MGESGGLANGLAMGGFDVGRFVSACLEAADGGWGGAPPAVHGLLLSVVSEPAALRDALGDPAHLPSVQAWHRSDLLTVLHVVLPPETEVVPHDHGSWGWSALYTGREDHHFYAVGTGGLIEPAGEHMAEPGGCQALGAATVHRVLNPTREWACSIQVYGGDLMGRSRRRWSLDTGRAEPHDLEASRRHLEHRAELARLARPGAPSR